ncbi:MAG: quinone-interacting membrane-bound oxidoreductase complex subunit QmoC [Gammaproteobacteria bacterium]|nr:quinone-interacting membrane-bound oxidoreductase complex subunit QmoC [Gammaproteobacteria bacterium]MDH3512594.1 quinone-interacting membrane-bound oxidoreductase complex subunit QmoC [Gammaproteobacteria bacterium]
MTDTMSQPTTGSANERVAINADLEFVEELLGSGAAELKYCYQCSTCTVVCPITPDESPFPRKEMIYAQFGLKEKLVSSLDGWLCMHCNDCSTHCPRGAKPGDVMNVIRSMSVVHFARPAFLAAAAQSPSRIWLLFLIPMIIIAAVILGLPGGSEFGFLSGTIVFSRMMPVPAIDAVFIPAIVFAVVTAVLSILGFLRSLAVEYPRTGRGESLLTAITGTVLDVFSHRRFFECTTNKSRVGAHALVMYGFIGLVITTTAVGILYYMDQFGMDAQVSPYDFFHPVKMLGNVSGTLAFLGCSAMLARRMSSDESGKATAFDWTFLWVFFMVVVTGFGSQVFRVLDLAIPAYGIYYVHLVLVFFLLAYLPYTKMGHMLFRAVAMIYARWSGRSTVQPVIRDGQVKFDVQAES